MKKILIIQLTWLLLMSTMLFGVTTGANFILGVNLNGNAVSIEGNLWKSEAQALQNGMSFSETPLSYVTNFNPIPTADSDTSAMLNSVHWTIGDWSVQQTLADGEYDIYVWIMENYRSNTRNIDIEIEDTLVAQDIGNITKSHWKKYGPYSVSVNDGRLDIKLLRKSGSEAHMMGFAVFGKSITLPTQDTINTISGPATIKHGESVTLNVDYEASQKRDLVVYLKSTTDTKRKSEVYIRREVDAGVKIEQFTFNVPNDAPTDETYKYGVYIAPIGKFFKDNLGKAYQQNVHVESDVVVEDKVSSISGQATIKHGETITLNVDYVASQKRDLVVYLKSTTDTKRKSEVYIRREVDAGAKIEQFTFNVPNDAPTDETYKYGVYIAPIGKFFKDNLGKAYQQNVHVESAEINDTTSPVITLNGESNITLNVGETYTELGATAIDDRDGNVSVDVNGTVDTNVIGKYIIVYTAIDSAQNESIVERHVTIEESIATPILQSISVSSNPINIRIGSGVDITVTGLFSNGNTQVLDDADYAISDTSIASVDGTGSIYGLEEGNTTLNIQAGAFTSSVAVVVAKELNTTNFNFTNFGNTYIDQIPTDATVESYDERRFCMIAGQILSVDGTPLQGVKVSIHKHPEYGTVLTDSNGTYAMPSEGGLQLTMRYSKQGYTSIDRNIQAPVQDWVRSPDVTMLMLDTKVTSINLANATVQMHVSTPVSDDRVERSTTLVFDAVTKATVTSADGSTRELTNLNVRATEFETPKSMPSDLPKESAYTYFLTLQ